MKFLFTIVILSITIAGSSRAQTWANIHNLDKWQKVLEPFISNDGHFYSYNVSNDPIGKVTFYVANHDETWKRSLLVSSPVTQVLFTNDQKQLIFHANERLYFWMLSKGNDRTISDVESWKHSTNKNDWFAYKTTNDSNQVVLLNPVSGRRFIYNNVDDYFFDASSKVFIVLYNGSTKLAYVNLPNSNARVVKLSAQGKISDVIVNQVDLTLVFKVTSQSGSKLTNSIWYYKEGLNSALSLNFKLQTYLEDISSLSGISRNGRYLFINMTYNWVPNKPERSSTSVDIWSYNDLVIQPEQVRINNSPSTLYKAVLDMKSGNMFPLDTESEQIAISTEEVYGDYIVVSNKVDPNFWWNSFNMKKYFIINLHSGEKRSLNEDGNALMHLTCSPNGKFLVYYNLTQRDFFCYNLQNNIKENLTAGVGENFSVDISNSPASQKPSVAPVVAWREDDLALILYDNYDIWEFDLMMKKKPMCLTSSYGKKSRTIFRLIDGPSENEACHFRYNRGQRLVLTAFKTTTKENGFYSITASPGSIPTKLVSGPYTFYRTSSQKPHYYSFDDGMKPIKSKHKQTFIVKRQSEDQPPNLFLTNDFRTYKQITDVSILDSTMLLSTELISWYQNDGRLTQGILYKPRNFNRNHKYPVIINFYRQVSHRLHEFIYPSLYNNNINIPWFTSRGYLVFTPDILYDDKNPPIREVFNSVIPAINRLKLLPYFDSNKIGLQGHSWGGAQTNYLITHSNLFAAASEFAGVADNISNYLSLTPFATTTPHSPNYYNTEWQFGAEKTLWEDKETYLDGSTVFNADKISCPLLIVHNKRDNQIPWNNGLELFMAMRRLGKKAWMLQYDNGNHGIPLVYRGDQVDYLKRLTQFFDYFLKDTYPPKWITEGRPANLKGIDDRLRLDTLDLHRFGYSKKLN